MYKFYRALFTFTGSTLSVEYGDPSIPSHSIWLIPGEGDDE